MTVEDTTTQERVSATDGGTEATARGPGSAPGNALPSGSSATAERIRDFEAQSRAQTNGSAAEQTRHYTNQRDVIDVESTVIGERDSR